MYALFLIIKQYELYFYKSGRSREITLMTHVSIRMLISHVENDATPPPPKHLLVCRNVVSMTTILWRKKKMLELLFYIQIGEKRNSMRISALSLT